MKENRYFIPDQAPDTGLKGLAKQAAYALRAAYFKVIMNRIRTGMPSKQYNVSVCTIFKDEAPYLREWLEFNHLAGVEHFYMYNNNSGDDFRAALEPYIARGWVTLVEWPHNQKQMECYLDAMERFREETRWLGFIDLDEFIVPKAVDNLYDFLAPFEKNRGSVKIYWRIFGSSGRMDRDLSSLVCEDFTVCWPKYDDIGKCFWNTAFDFPANPERKKQLHHHLWTEWKGRELPPVNCFDQVCIGSRNKALCEDFPIQINHYFTKSWKEYAMKKAKGDVYFKVNPHDEAYFFEHEMKCTGTDYSAYRYLIKLKQALAGDMEGKA